MEHILFLLIGIFYFLPFLSLIRYYTIIRTREYFIGSIIFLSLTVNGIGIFFLGLGTFLEIVTVYIAMFLLILVSQRLLPSSRRKYIPHLLAVFVLLTAINFLAILSDDPVISTGRIIAFEINRLLVGCFIFIAYSQLQLVVVNQRTKTVKAVWQWSGMLLIAISIIRLIDTTIYLISSYPNVLPDSERLALSLLIIAVGMLVISVLTSYLALFYPEVFLLSKYQINAVDDLYDISDQLREVRNIPVISTHEALLDYLKALSTKFDDDT